MNQEIEQQAVAWFPTNDRGELVRNYGDGSAVFASKTRGDAEWAKRCHLGATGPVIPLYTRPQPAAPAPMAGDPVCVNHTMVQRACESLFPRMTMHADHAGLSPHQRKAMFYVCVRDALNAALAQDRAKDQV